MVKTSKDPLTYKTTLSEVTVTAACAKIKETPSADITDEQRAQVNIWAREKRVLLVSIGGVSTKGAIKEAKVDGNGDSWKYDGFDFTAQQYQKLAGFVKEKTKVKVTIKPQEELLTDGLEEEE